MPRPRIVRTRTWDQTRNLGMCPDQESNPQPFGDRMVVQPTEPHQPEPGSYFLSLMRVLGCGCLTVLGHSALQEHVGWFQRGAAVSKLLWAFTHRFYVDRAALFSGPNAEHAVSGLHGKCTCSGLRDRPTLSQRGSALDALPAACE